MPQRDIEPFLEEAHRRWLADPPAPQSSQRTRSYQEAAREYLTSTGFNPENLALDRRISAAFDKEYDLVYAPYDIPRLAISFKIIPLHELSAHARSRVEEATGDAANVHMQFPDLVLGYFWVLAVDPNKTVAEGDWKNLRQALPFLSRLTGRPSADSPISRYEGIGIYPCSWTVGRRNTEQEETLRRVKGQIPRLLAPGAMMGLLLANYRLRFGDLHEPA